METRSQGLKRHLAEVEADPDKPKARETIQPLLAKAKRSGDPVHLLGEEAKTLTEAEQAKFRMVFNLFDDDLDGHVTQPEFEAVLRNLGFRVGPQEAGLMMREADKDEKVDEFIALMARLVQTTEKEEEEAEKEKEEEEKAKESKTKKRKTSHSSTKTTSSKDKGKTKKTKEEEEEDEEEQKKPKKTPRRLKRADSKLNLTNKGRSSSSGAQTVSLPRGLSISDFYTNFAGLHDQISGAARRHREPSRSHPFGLRLHQALLPLGYRWHGALRLCKVR